MRNVGLDVLLKYVETSAFSGDYKEFKILRKEDEIIDFYFCEDMGPLLSLRDSVVRITKK